MQKGLKKEQILYLNFEDERLSIEAHQLDWVIQSYRELFPEQKLAKCYFFFDEIQNIKGWEKFVRRVYDSVSKNVFITGSNANLLSTEVATSLGGRTITFEIYPFLSKNICGLIK